jgi:hypothetical protein
MINIVTYLWVKCHRNIFVVVCTKSIAEVRQIADTEAYVAKILSERQLIKT